MIKTMMLRAGRFRLPVQYIVTEDRMFLKFGYNKSLLSEIKGMEGSRWHGFEDGTYHELLRSVFQSIKCWSIADSPRNRFQLDYLQGKDVYARWDHEVILNTCKTDRHLYQNQVEMVSHAQQMHYTVLAAEMGLGKTLAAIEIMEQSGNPNWWFVAPRSALASVERELRKWKSAVIPDLMTYKALVKRIDNWSEGDPTPIGVFFDESSKLKTPSTQRSKAAQHLADAIREEHGPVGFVVLMSGSPSPKSPADWWKQCEIAWPGFLKEGNRTKFEMRLGVFEQMETSQGSTFQHRITWLDDSNKCQECGQLRESPCHTHRVMPSDHQFVRSKNEIEAQYRRMKGLVLVQFKKDCLDLPDKVYRIVECPPLPSTLRAAQLIKNTTSRAAQALILMRELSDGFQYQNVEDGIKECEVCFGKKTMVCPDTGINDDCVGCGGSGTVPKYVRKVNRIDCPKDDALIGLLDEHHDVGRLVVYAGFQASVDRCCEIALKEKWSVIRWDGRGTKITSPSGPITGVDPLDLFNDTETYGRVAFIGHPGSAGMGLTLTASPTIVYYSNDFNAESRIQSEDRIHRIGCKGAQIIDIIHLPTDEFIISNLKEKRRLQDITMGQLDAALT